MSYFKIHAGILIISLLLTTTVIGQERAISEKELNDKISAFWLGQLVGNYYGLPFENKYIDEAVPFLVDRMYTYKDDEAIILNRYDWRGFIPIFMDAVEGAFADDDTDIEFITLHAVEKYGLDLTYPEITEMWKKHINRRIWVANATARSLMSNGFVAPETGRKGNNRNWFQIDPQLVNEIWSAFYPGMTKKAAERALWGARITNDDWGTHPTIAYGVMISAAFFEKDVEKLVQMAIEAVPNEGPFAEGMRDVVKWHKENDNWRDTRKKIHDKYYRYKKGSYEAPVSVVSSLNNGLCGIMAILYGEGDFMKTVGIAVSAGYDCDNQAATCAGLIGVLKGTKCLPKALVEEFNNQYVCFTRDEVQIATPLSEIEERIAAIAKKAILENGGRVEIRRNEAPSVKNKTLSFTYGGADHTMQFDGYEEASITGGNYNKDMFIEYIQEGDRVRWEVWENEDPPIKFEGFYDGKNIVSVKEIFVDIFDEDIYGEITYIVNSDF
ncbi:MAG: ADP-ribosylglycohydrolase family protein [Bacteroidales bacterium]|nr:ADP-ribosylglycohydrolase family protein [Bacteroidales bacterium]